MATPTPAMMDAMIHGIGLTKIMSDARLSFSPWDFFQLPMPCERNPWEGCQYVWINFEPYDDGGGPALAAYRWANCV